MEYVAEELDVPYLRLPALKREVSFLPDLEAIRELRILLRTRQPDVLHTHTSKAARQVGLLRSSRDAAVQRWSCIRSTATCSAGTSTRGGSARSGSSSGCWHTQPIA